MTEARAAAPSSGDDPRVRFRRATEQDAYELARTAFLADERVDMQTLALELGVSRATLHRWVRTREALLDRVLGELATEYFALGRAQAQGDPDDVIVRTTGAIATVALRSAALRGFVDREPALALRLLLSDQGTVRRRLHSGLRGLIAEVLPDEADRLAGFAEVAVEVGLALVWPPLVAGDEPSGEHIDAVTRALLIGARAGVLPAPG